MSETSYITTVVKLLEVPECKVIHGKYQILECRAQLPQRRQKSFITLRFWGQIAYESAKYYQMNDYLLIKGHVSISAKKVSRFEVNSISQEQKIITKKRIKINIRKVYPLLLHS